MCKRSSGPQPRFQGGKLTEANGFNYPDSGGVCGREGRINPRNRLSDFLKNVGCFVCVVLNTTNTATLSHFLLKSPHRVQHMPRLSFCPFKHLLSVNLISNSNYNLILPLSSQILRDLIGKSVKV